MIIGHTEFRIQTNAEMHIGGNLYLTSENNWEWSIESISSPRWSNTQFWCFESRESRKCALDLQRDETLCLCLRYTKFR
jgi:hypothetical protein